MVLTLYLVNYLIYIVSIQSLFCNTLHNTTIFLYESTWDYFYLKILLFYNSTFYFSTYV